MPERADILKLAPAPVAKPWGLRNEAVKVHSSIVAGIGELWLASGQRGPGNYSNTVTSPPGQGSLADILEAAARRGGGELKSLLGTRAFDQLRHAPRWAKAESWYVRHAVGRTGVASGPRTAAERQQLKELFLSRKLGSDVENWPEETRQLLGLIEPLKGGEVFYLPSGTIHTMFAIGPESCLVVDEIQQGYGRSLLPTLSKVLVVQDDLLSIQVHPAMHAIKSLASGELRINQDLDSNPTVRLYDFGRRSGENPELGLRLASVPGGFRRLAPVSVSSSPGTMLEIMVACEHFVRTRQTISRGAVAKLQPVYDSYRVLHCAEGVCSVECSSRQWRLSTGETAFVPAELEPELTIRAESECWLFDDAVPDLDVLRAFLTKSGATPCDIDAVANPL